MKSYLNRTVQKPHCTNYFTLATSCYHPLDPRAMKKETSGLLLNDYDQKDGKAQEASTLYLKNLSIQTNQGSRHAAIDKVHWLCETAATAIKNKHLHHFLFTK